MTYTTTEEEKKKLNGGTIESPQSPAAAAPFERGANGGAQNEVQQSTQQNTQGGTVHMRYDPASDAAYQQALSVLTAANKNAPKYAGTYDGQLADLYNQIVNRDKFSYSVNDDALYQQYAQQYAQAGRLAMQDTMGQAAALTGGYGSSYGQSVGQQHYDAYLQRLNEVVPELYNAAYGRYQDEGNALAQQYAMMGDLKNQEYAQYQDAYSRWANERANAQNLEQQAYERGQNDWKVGYTQALDKAETLAKSGDFSGYAELYGQGTADNMRRSWLSSNPDLAYRNGMMTAEEYKAMTGEYPAGYVAPNAGETGGGDDGNKKTTFNSLSADISNGIESGKLSTAQARELVNYSSLSFEEKQKLRDLINKTPVSF